MERAKKIIEEYAILICKAFDCSWKLKNVDDEYFVLVIEKCGIVNTARIQKYLSEENIKKRIRSEFKGLVDAVLSYKEQGLC